MRHVLKLTVIIALALPAWATAEDKTADASAMGRIIDIGRDPDRVTVLTRKGELKLRVAGKTKINFDGKKAEFKKLQIGDAVKVRYERGGDKGHRALELTSGPTTAREVGKQFREALGSAGKFAYREKEQFQKQMKDLMSDLDARVVKLTAQTKGLAGDARERAMKELEKLKERRKAVGRELEQAGSATAEAWEDIKKGFSKAAGELGDAVDKAFEDGKPKEK